MHDPFAKSYMNHPPAFSSFSAIFQGVLTALAFSLLLAGSNAMTPLLPLQRSMLGFSPLMLTLTFVSYVSTLIAVLLIFSRPSFTKWASWTVCAAMLTAIVADLALATVTETGILLGRALTGIAGGLGTGAASALVVAAIGAKGRSVSATGNLAGAVAGTTAAQLLVAAYGYMALHITFELHAAACLLVLILLAPVLYVRRAQNRQSLSSVHMASAPPRVASDFRARKRVLAVGCTAWMLLSLSIVLLPTYFAELDMRMVGSTGIILFLACSALSQLASNRLKTLLPATSGTWCMVWGGVLILAGAYVHRDLLAMAGFVALGIGTGVSYRLVLMVLVKNASPSHQGAIASFYAAVTYGASASSVLVAGLMGNVLGIQNTVVAVFLMLICATAWLSKGAPRLGQI